MFNVTCEVFFLNFAQTKLSKVCLLSSRPIFTSVWLCEAVKNFFTQPLALSHNAPRVHVVNSCHVCAKFHFPKEKTPIPLSTLSLRSLCLSYQKFGKYLEFSRECNSLQICHTYYVQ